MRKILIFFILYFHTSPLISQPSIPVEQIDSIFNSIRVSDNDWAISISIQQAGTLPIYDSLGNIVSESLQGTFLFFKIGKDHFVQKLWYEYLDNPYGTRVIHGKRLSLGKKIGLDYSIDSIMLVDKEWINPFIYKDDTTNTYNVQQPADHEPYYGMYFKTGKVGYTRFFTETSLTESESFLISKNLNFRYNTSTFIYRSFTKLLSLIEANRKALDN